MMVRQQETFHIDRQLRADVYAEITRLVGNMRQMQEKSLRLEITFPDTDTRGLHHTWEFTRSLVVHVTPRK